MLQEGALITAGRPYWQLKCKTVTVSHTDWDVVIYGTFIVLHIIWDVSHCFTHTHTHILEYSVLFRHVLMFLMAVIVTHGTCNTEKWLFRGACNTMDSWYILVIYNTIIHTEQQIQWYNFDQTLNSQTMPNISPSRASYWVSSVRMKCAAIYRERTVQGSGCFTPFVLFSGTLHSLQYKASAVQRHAHKGNKKTNKKQTNKKNENNNPSTNWLQNDFKSLISYTDTIFKIKLFSTHRSQWSHIKSLRHNALTYWGRGKWQ